MQTLQKLQTPKTEVMQLSEQTLQLMNSLVSNSYAGLTQYESQLTEQKAMFEGTSIAKIQKLISPENLLKAFTFLVLRTSELFNFRNNITNNQAVVLALDLIDVMKVENVEDVILMLKMARQGKLGQKLYRLDNQIIFQEWVPEYLNKKAELREKIWQNKKYELNKIYHHDSELSSDAEKYFNEIIKTISSKKEKKPTPPNKNPYATKTEKLNRQKQVVAIISNEELKYINRSKTNSSAKIKPYLQICKNELIRLINLQKNI